MAWMGTCTLVHSHNEGGQDVHTVRLRGADPTLEVVISGHHEMPFHLGLEYVVTIEAVEGAFV